MENTILVLLIFHFLGDYIFQTSWMATNKHRNIDALGSHVLIYSVPFLIFGPLFWIITFITHFCVDFFTSKLSNDFYKTNRIRQFFILLGLDQLIHHIQLILTYKYLF